MLRKLRSLVSGVPLLPNAPGALRVAAQDSAPRTEPHWPAVEGSRRGLSISPALLEQLQAMQGAQGGAVDWAAKFKPADVAPGTLPANHKPQELAMDSMCDNMAATIGACSGFNQVSGIDFIGYAALSLLSQHPLIRAMVETLADEMTRKWIRFGGRGEEESDAKRAKLLDDATKKFQLKENFKSAMATTGYMGGAMLFIDMGDDSDTPDGQAELLTPLTLDPGKIPKGKFKGFQLIEPINCYPAPYNANNPLKKGYYRPNAWMVQGRTVHGSRLLRFTQNEVPILLRPSYNFFGVPLAQMALDYVDRFDTVRIAVAKLVKRFSTSILKTDMSQMLNGGGYDDATSLKARALLWQMMGSNDGLMTLDMEAEEFVQVNTPLSGLGDIVSQQLELLAAISRTPAVKLLGISPKGFNATGEYDESNWYDHVASQQSAVFAQPLDFAVKVIQLSEFGKIDEDLTHAFLPLHELSETEKAQNRKSNADTAAAYIDRGVLSVEEERARLAADPDSGYDSLDVDDLPEPPNNPNDTDDDGNPGTAADGELKEDDQPREKDGKFASGGGSEAKKKREPASSGEPLRQLSGSELHSEAHPSLTPENVVDAASAYFKKHLQGKTVSRPDIGDVRITGRAWKKMKRGLPHEMERARMIPAIPDLIANGEHMGRVPVDKPRRDSTVAFHYLRGTVELDGQPKQVGVSVGEDQDGNFAYNFTHDPQDLLDRKEERKRASNLPGLEAQGMRPSQDSSAAHDSSIDHDGNDLNLVVLSGPEGGV